MTNKRFYLLLAITIVTVLLVYQLMTAYFWLILKWAGRI